MNYPRFIGDFALTPGADLQINDPAIQHQLLKVLRLRQGEILILSDGQMHEAKCKISNIGKNGVTVKVISISENKNELAIPITLCCAILKKENFLFIGPEGGWNEEEINYAKKNRAEIIALSHLTYRAETAAIVVCHLAAASAII